MPQQPDASNLIGLWSVDWMCAPGALGDEILLFFPDGSGRLDLDNPFTVNAWTFGWTIQDTARMRIVGECAFEIDDSPTRVAEYDWDYEEVLGFSIKDEETRPGRRMPVLRFEHSLMDWLPSEFGFVTHQIADRRSPDFSWVDELNRGYLGVYVAQSPKKQGGVVIQGVNVGSAAHLQRIAVGDIIRCVDGRMIETMEDFQSVIEGWRPGQVVSVELVRGGTRLTKGICLMSYWGLFSKGG